MNAIERYNLARDREQHAFEDSNLGNAVRLQLNARVHYAAHHRGEHSFKTHPMLQLCLAAEYAFGARMPAFYAGRSLRLWGFNGEPL